MVSSNSITPQTVIQFPFSGEIFAGGKFDGSTEGGRIGVDWW